jgi:SM-20-related protein
VDGLSTQKMLNLNAVRTAPVVRDPFNYLIADDVVPRDAMRTVGGDFPRISSTGSFPLSEVSYGPAFGQLIGELTDPAFRDVLAQRFGVNLSTYFPIVTVRGRIGRRDGSAHTDAAWKVMTVLLYLNETWEHGGGRLRLLRDNDVNHTIVEIPPKWGTMLAFLRSDRSWHGHLPAEGERRVVQLNWVTSREKADAELRRHRRSGWLKRLFGRSY